MALSAAHAALLADQVRGRGRLARWALRWLVWTGNRGDPRATDTVWNLWLGEPSDELWEALARWRRPHTGGGSSLVALGQPAAAAVVIEAACRADPTCLFASPDGMLAVGGQEFVEVAAAGCSTAVVALADWPLAATSPADLYAVTAQLSRTPPRSPVRLFLELLRGCLAYRFGMEVAIGEAAPVHARGDDIALGGSV
jgi:hypothetical protein